MNGTLHMKGVEINKKTNAGRKLFAAAAFTVALMCIGYGKTAEASENAVYMCQNSDQTSETVKWREIDVYDMLGEGETASYDTTVQTGEDEDPGDILNTAEAAVDQTQASLTALASDPEYTQATTPIYMSEATPTTIPAKTPAGTPAPAHTHSYSATVTKTADCTENGLMTYTCSCGDSYVEIIPATGHNYRQTGSTAPTCTEDGLVTYTCMNCGETTSGTIPAAGHVWEDRMEQVYVVDEAAWDEEYEDGYGENHWFCNVCGFDFTAAGYTNEELGEHDKAHVLAFEGSGWHNAVVYIPVTVTVHHDEIGHYEEQATGRVCAVCGATQ